MLVLSRKLQESIVFPDLGITVRVISVSGGRVRLGVEAPRHVKIARGELCDQGGEVVAPRRGEEHAHSLSGQHAVIRA